MSIGENIRALRKKKNMEQTELGRLLGVSGKTVSSWETDRTEPRAAAIEKMAEIFGCQQSDIISGPNSNLKVVFDSRKEPLAMDIAQKAAQLSIEQQHQVMDFIAYLKGKNK